MDVTRLLSRAGRPLTGVDRVERAYLAALLDHETPLFGLTRTAFGYLLLERAGLSSVLARIDGRVPWGAADRLSRLGHRGAPWRQRAEAEARRLAVARAPRGGLARLLSRRLPPGTAYLNVGHSNLTARVLGAVKRVPGATIAVMLHDTIPLDFPDYQRPGTPERFAGRLRRAGAAADLLIYNSHDTRRRAEAHLAKTGRVPPAVTAHLGVDLAPPDPGGLPVPLPPEPPYFVTVGTIEPRKNHLFLLDLWAEAKLPYPLVIAGSRGWNNVAVFARLEARPPAVIEAPGLSDGALSALIAGAAGVLMPSLAEGFGLPAGETAALEVPLICNDLPVYGEYLGDYPVYAPVSDRYLWQTTIKRLAETASQQTPGKRPPMLPTWEAHFKTVLTMT